MNHPACEEWEKRKDFVDTEIDDVLDHLGRLSKNHLPF